MFAMALSMLLTGAISDERAAAKDVAALISTMEALQQPIKDFRCEYEGSLRVKGTSAKGRSLGDDGLLDSFSGVFIWKNGGDTHSDSMHRMAPSGMILRKSLVVRIREHQAEEYQRENDAPLGVASVKSWREVTSWQPGCLGRINLFDKIKRDFTDEWLDASVDDDQAEGRPLKVLTVALKDVPGSLLFRYWIDLRRSGQVVRMETYAPGKLMDSRMDINLASFNVGDTEMWIPVSGEFVGYAGIENDKPSVAKEPTVLETIYVVGGTMEFNKRPGPEVFTIKYKPGTPISDHLRQMTTEFGEKIGAKLTKADAEKMLNEQVSKAQEQNNELVVASSSEGFDWWPWTVWGMSGVVLVSLVALAIQRRRR